MFSANCLALTFAICLTLVHGLNLSESDLFNGLCKKVVDVLRQLQDFDQFSEVADVVSRHHIVCQQTLQISYRPYKAEQALQLTVFPYLLKEFRNRWFLFASKCEDMALQTLALDRIVCVKVVDDIPWRENPDFDNELLKKAGESFGGSPLFS